MALSSTTTATSVIRMVCGSTLGTWGLTYSITGSYGFFVLVFLCLLALVLLRWLFGCVHVLVQSRFCPPPPPPSLCAAYANEWLVAFRVVGRTLRTEVSPTVFTANLNTPSVAQARHYLSQTGALRRRMVCVGTSLRFFVCACPPVLFPFVFSFTAALPLSSLSL